MPTCTWQVSVGDLTGVTRVLSMLTSRRYVLTSFQAHRKALTWWVEIVVVIDPGGVDLLTRRLGRLPTADEVRTPSLLTTDGGDGVVA